MSRNGSGTYTLPAGNPVVTGTTIASTWANNTLSDIASTLTDSVAADGQTAMTGNLNLNSNKIVNVADPTLAQDAATKNYSDTTYLAKASNLSDVANATTSRTNISAAKSGANSDITSLTGLTTPLTVAQGGTGAATLTANNVLLGNGTSAPQVVAPSTAGNVLTSNGTTWVSSSSSSGKVLQVVQGTLSGSVTYSSPTSFTQTTLTASITPTSATSKILVMMAYCYNNASSGQTFQATVYKNNTTNLSPNSGNAFSVAKINGATEIQVPFSFNYLDSPTTTSSTSYTCWVRSSSGNITLGDTVGAGTVILMEIAA